MKKFLSIVLLLLLVVSPVIVVDAATTKKTTTTSAAAKKTTTTKKTTTKKTAAKKTSAKKSTTESTTTTKKEANDDAISVHVFYSSSCGYCKALHEFLDELANDKTYGKMFKVVDYEVSDATNAKLYKDVATYLNADYDGSVPFYVIGKQYFSGYASESHDESIKNAIKTSYESKKYEDVVAKIIDGVDDDKNIAGYIILGVVAVIIIIVIISSSKNSYYEDDETEDNKVSENETPEKEEVKKTSSTAKKTTAKKKSNSTNKSK